MFIIIQYSRGNTLFYLRNKNKEPINSKVIAIPSENYQALLFKHIEKLVSETNNKIEEIRFILLEMNDIECLSINAVCEVSRYLKLKLDTSVIVTNNIETFDYNEYLSD
ncbi:hypothetical protein [Staphylococcus edaphicus]|uniref:Uncharacterized protein n=1 Tax=Staphylococcus edaphicus TaxID=1955013 RepID=A0A2C6VIG5_9STAP|nr:hypothetical protein [Staphylococcus edaphicus]PHK50021.1 hypothetical protein BTJ66_05810 [Staphylococcus edaphicus]UQW81719.1 hypothetical protein MNY58_00985 [Staphylococcus edaphicus]